MPENSVNAQLLTIYRYNADQITPEKIQIKIRQKKTQNQDRNQDSERH